MLLVHHYGILKNMTNKRMRVDQETLDLVREYAEVLKKDTGVPHANYQAVKIALRKVLLK